MRLQESVSRRAMVERLSLARNSRELVFGMAVVFAIAIFSLAINLQGWRSRIPAFDLLTYIHSARNFLETGAIPPHGDTGSYGSYKPAGTAWLMMPSTILFEDPRLSEYVGTALLHIATLAGLFLLGRTFLGFTGALLAVVLYGLSEHSYFFAGSLWPNGRPDFYVWVVLFTCLWVVRKDARYLAAALAVWGIGMQVDMGITPAFFILPAALLIYRPPLRLKPLLISGSLVLIAWLPYLRFEASRGFADIRSQLLQQHISHQKFKRTWCDPALTLRQYVPASRSAQSEPAQTQTPDNQDPTPLRVLSNTWQEMEEKALSNFQPIAQITGASYLLLFLTLCSLLILSVPGFATEKTRSIDSKPAWRHWIHLLAAGAILSGLIISAFLIIFLSGREDTAIGTKILFLYKLRKILLLSGIALLLGIWAAMGLNLLLIRYRIHIQQHEQVGQSRLLVICLLIPWFLLLVLAEPGKPERFWWLWPLQSLFLAAFFTNILPRFSVSKWVIRAGMVAVILLIAGNSFLFDKLAAWSRTGWAGQDADEVQVVDFIAQQVQADGRDQAAVGYQTFIYPFMAQFNITNPVYKVGAEFDLLLRYRHGIHNLNQCAEGVSAADEYRIVETRPKAPDWSPKSYFPVKLDDRFQRETRVGTYEIYRSR